MAELVSRFLTSDGADDDSTAEMAGDHTTPADFYAGPGADDTWALHSLIWVVADTTITPAAFGDAGFLTNGIHFAITAGDGTTELESLSGGFPIKAPWQAMHSGWEYVTLDTSGSPDMLQMRYVFPDGVTLRGGHDERVEIQLADNLSGLSDMYVFLKATVG